MALRFISPFRTARDQALGVDRFWRGHGAVRARTLHPDQDGLRRSI